MNHTEMNILQLEAVCGGKNNKNPTLDRPDAAIDSIVNGKNYDYIAQKIADWLNGDDTRSRGVNNSMNIYDVDI